MSAAVDRPEQCAGFPVWYADHQEVRVAFVGRGPALDRRELFRTVSSEEHEVAWLRQVHGDNVLEATAGCAGDGDALLTERPDLALAIATADCVPVVIACGSRIAVVHAGWRGIESRIAEAAAGSVIAGVSEPAVAWIGPAIGRCCYEVSAGIADRLAAVGGGSAIVFPGPRGRPLIDLAAAVEHQLGAAGVARVEKISVCTRCNPRWSWSYRRDGEAAGRNLTFAWRVA